MGEIRKDSHRYSHQTMKKFDGQFSKHKFWMAYVIIFCQAVWNPIFISISTLQFYLASILLFLFFVLNFFIRKKTDISLRQPDSFPLWAYFGYSLVFLLSILIHGVDSFAIGNFARVSSLIVLLIFIKQFEAGLERLVSLYLLLNCCFSVVLGMNLISSGINISNRISPIGQGSANSFGATLAIVLILRLSLHNYYSRNENVRIYFVSFPIIFATILGTFSRGATLGLILGLLVLGMQQIKVAYVPKILGFICLLVIANEFYGLSRLAVLSRYSTSSFQDSSGRSIIFQNALIAFSKNPIFGAGVGSKLNPFSSGEASVHNVFLQAVGETGLIGLCLLLLILTITATRYCPKTSLPSLACLFMVSLTDNHFLAVQFHLTVGLVYLALLRDRFQKKQTR